MSAKCAFFGVLQKIMVICCAIFFGITHAFSANLPSGYTELEYIESTGTQYIDTGRTLSTATDDVELVFQLTDATVSQNIFGARGSTTNRVYTFASYYSTNLRTGWVSTTRLVDVIPNTNKHTLKIEHNGGIFKLDGVTIAEYGNDSITTPTTATLFAIHATASTELYYGATKIYEYKLWNNGTLVQHLIPVKYVSGNTTTYGMYDTVNNVFYQNAGTGEFTGGPVACPGGTLQTYTTVAASDVPAPVQNGTPTPTNPITPTFYTQGNMILRKVGDYADSYDASTGKITRRVGVKVLDGTETGWVRGTNSIYIDGSFNDAIGYSANNPAIICSHFRGGLPTITTSNMPDLSAKLGASSQPRRMYFVYDAMTTAAQFQQFLAEQHANGTPVTVYYPLVTPVEENWAPEQCTSSSSPIKIATTAYNAARFNPVVNDLNSTVATIRDIVTNTINQTAAIASLQADKQTRPEDACPAGKKCLLVETEENGVIVPHWYPIIESADD